MLAVFHKPTGSTKDKSLHHLFQNLATFILKADTSDWWQSNSLESVALDALLSLKQQEDSGEGDDNSSDFPKNQTISQWTLSRTQLMYVSKNLLQSLCHCCHTITSLWDKVLDSLSFPVQLNRLHPSCSVLKHRPVSFSVLVCHHPFYNSQIHFQPLKSQRLYGLEFAISKIRLCQSLKFNSKISNHDFWKMSSL